MITNLDHIAICIIDKNISIRFYRDILGLKYITSINMGDHELTYFQLNESTRLELIEYFEIEERICTLTYNKGIYKHMALTTDDIQSLYENCYNNQIEITMKPQYIKNLNSMIMLITDPNGVQIELVQRKG